MSSTDISQKIPAGGAPREAGSATRVQQRGAKQAPESPAVQALNKLGLTLFQLRCAIEPPNDTGRNGRRLVVSRNLEVNESCEQLLMSQLRCSVDRVAFNASGAEDVADAVNDAFAASSPLLGKVLAPDAVDPTAKLLLASAFYFRGVLEPPFQRCAEKRAFKPNLSTSVELEYVGGTGSFLYAEVEEPVAAKALELPYRAGSVSLLLLVPDRSPRLKDLRAQLTPAFLAKLHALLRRRTVRVELPLTKAEARYTLNTTLFRTGVRQAFMPGAEFNGLVPTGEVRVGDFLHKATLVLDEGRPADDDAAPRQASSTAAQQPADVELALTRPFLFVLRRSGDGCILLVGVVRELKEPQQQ
ncbi:hypothetical protein V5799_007971 [Amblyomma americanum]|uniref:Serpin domain-containing protein n=1 Tax=Amblyomma americanum TaxID=6943 RepID=A0AAQ4FGG7_AMBAM